VKKWQNSWKNNYVDVSALSNHYSEDELKVLSEVSNRHPLSIPEYYFNLIDQKDPQDPIKLLSYPSLFEADLAGDYDTSGEGDNTKMPGLQHKYGPTALVLTTNACFMYCRHCFRKRMVGYSVDEINTRMDEAVDYIKSHTEINNVLLSGGDALCMDNEHVEGYLSRLSAIDHLNFIRIGTRSLVVFPERITSDPELIEILSKYHQKKRIIIITQFNHPRELTSEAKDAVDALIRVGITVNNQAVVLKGINDQPEIMAQLLNGLTAMGITPYYVFQCRPVTAVKAGFQLPLIETYQLIRNTRPMLNGISKRFRLIMSHVRGKIELIGLEGNQLYFKFHNAKASEDTGKLFARTMTPTASWLDDDLNLID